MKISHATLGDSNLSHHCPYIYFISYISPSNNGYLYIGETSEQFGALGRLSRHLSYRHHRNGATFLDRLNRFYCFNDDFDIVKNIDFIAINIEEYGCFEGDEYKTRRTGLEFLVRSEMQAFSSDDLVRIPYEIISTAQENRYSRQIEIIKIANEIVGEIAQRLIFVKGDASNGKR